MPVVASRNMAAPLFSPNGTHSAGTAIWQAPFESLTIFQPAGTVCARRERLHRRATAQTAYSLMAGVYSRTRPPTRPLFGPGFRGAPHPFIAVLHAPSDHAPDLATPSPPFPPPALSPARPL